LKTSIQNLIQPSISLAKLKQIQEKLALKVITKNVLPSKIIMVCGVDVSYKDNTAYGAAVIFDISKKEVIEVAKSTLKVTSPYIPGFFVLREAKPILKTLNKLTKEYDLLLVDGNGQLHPRRCGLACYIGLVLNKPVIGVAKKLLCGKVKKNKTVEYEGNIIGYEISHKGKKIYVSVGHKISLKKSVKIIKELFCKNRQPEPLRLADTYSKIHSKMNHCY
jgi:deoxyribonuclease V